MIVQEWLDFQFKTIYFVKCIQQDDVRKPIQVSESLFVFGVDNSFSFGK